MKVKWGKNRSSRPKPHYMAVQVSNPGSQSIVGPMRLVLTAAILRLIVPLFPLLMSDFPFLLQAPWWPGLYFIYLLQNWPEIVSFWWKWNTNRHLPILHYPREGILSIYLMDGHVCFVLYEMWQALIRSPRVVWHQRKAETKVRKIQSLYCLRASHREPGGNLKWHCHNLTHFLIQLEMNKAFVYTTGATLLLRFSPALRVWTFWWHWRLVWFMLPSVFLRNNTLKAEPDMGFLS